MKLNITFYAEENDDIFAMLKKMNAEVEIGYIDEYKEAFEGYSAWIPVDYFIENMFLESLIGNTIFICSYERHWKEDDGVETYTNHGSFLNKPYINITIPLPDDFFFDEEEVGEEEYNGYEEEMLKDLCESITTSIGKHNGVNIKVEVE